MQTHFGWEDFGKHKFTLDDPNQMTVTAKVGCSSLYGRNIASRGSKYTWNVRINRGRSIIIGVSHMRLDVPQINEKYFWFTDHESGFGYFGGSGNKWTNNEYRLYGENFGEYDGPSTDVITVSLDLRDQNGQQNGTISFAKNGKNYGVAYDTLSLNEHYRLAVLLFEPNSSVTLLSHETEY